MCGTNYSSTSKVDVQELFPMIGDLNCMTDMLLRSTNINMISGEKLQLTESTYQVKQLTFNLEFVITKPHFNYADLSVLLSQVNDGFKLTDPTHTPNPIQVSKHIANVEFETGLFAAEGAKEYQVALRKRLNENLTLFETLQKFVSNDHAVKFNGKDFHGHWVAIRELSNQPDPAFPYRVEMAGTQTCSRLGPIPDQYQVRLHLTGVDLLTNHSLLHQRVVSLINPFPELSRREIGKVELRLVPPYLRDFLSSIHDNFKTAHYTQQVEPRPNPIFGFEFQYILELLDQPLPTEPFRDQLRVELNKLYKQIPPGTIMLRLDTTKAKLQSIPHGLYLRPGAQSYVDAINANMGTQRLAHEVLEITKPNSTREKFKFVYFNKKFYKSRWVAVLPVDSTTRTPLSEVGTHLVLNPNSVRYESIKFKFTNDISLEQISLIQAWLSLLVLNPMDV